MTLQPKVAQYRGPGPRRFGPEFAGIATMHGRATRNERSHFIHASAYDVDVRNYDAAVAVGKTVNLILLTVSVPALARASGKPDQKWAGQRSG